MTQDIETNVFDTPAREYMPSQSRWPNVDPAHASWNGYAYVTNPLQSSDPSGLFRYTGPATQAQGGDNPSFDNVNVLMEFVYDVLSGLCMCDNAHSLTTNGRNKVVSAAEGYTDALNMIIEFGVDEPNLVFHASTQNPNVGVVTNPDNAPL